VAVKGDRLVRGRLWWIAPEVTDSSPGSAREELTSRDQPFAERLVLTDPYRSLNVAP
jgi:hypothetical protein